MRITKKQLQEMINDAVSDALRPRRRNILEVGQAVDGPLLDVDPADLIEFGDAYLSLGRDGRKVLKLLLDDPTSVGEDVEDEIDDIEMKLAGMNSMIADAVAQWRDLSSEPQG